MMRRVRKILLTVLTVAFVAFATLFAISCGEKGEGSFKLSKTSVEIVVGKEAAAIDVLKDGEVYTGPVSWVAEDANVVQVNQGRLAGLRAGETDVKAYIPYGEKTFVLTCEVEVSSSITAKVVDMYAYSGTGSLDVTLPAGMISGGAKVTGLTYSINADGSNATRILPTPVGDYYLENESDSALTPGTYHLFYEAKMEDVEETIVRKLFVRGIDRYEDLFLLAPFDDVNEDVYGFARALPYWQNGVKVDNPGEYVRYSDTPINVATGMNETKDELIESLQASGYDGFLDPAQQTPGYDTVYRMYVEKYNKTSAPRPFFFLNLFNTANPAWNSLSELPDDATISVWVRAWFKSEDSDTYVTQRSGWFYFFKNMNGGIEEITAGESHPASYDKVGGWCNYRVPIAKIREALSGANNIAFAIQVDGTQRGSCYFEIYSVELMATNNIMASTNEADVTLPGLYSGYFDSYTWSIESTDENNNFTASGTNAKTSISIPSGEYVVTYVPKQGTKSLPTVERILYSGLVTNFSKAADVSQGGWGRSVDIRALFDDTIPQEVGTPNVADGYRGFLANAQTQSVIAVDKFSSNGANLGRIDACWNINSVLSIVLNDMKETDPSKQVLKDSDYIGIWAYVPAERENVTISYYLAEGNVHASNDQYTVGGGYVKSATQANGWFQIKITVGELKTTIAKKLTTKIEQNISGKPSMKDVAIKYDTIGIQVLCDDGAFFTSTAISDVYLYSVEFSRSLNSTTSNELNTVSLAYSDDEWDRATFNGVIKNALTGRILEEGVDYEIKNGKFVSYLYGEFAFEYEVEKDGYSYGIAERNVVLEKDKNSPMGYNVVSDLMSSKDMFYYAGNVWGAAAVTHNASKVKFGDMAMLSNADYDALIAAGYKGSLTKKAVWRAANLQPTNIDHNGNRTAIAAGSAMFNEKLIVLMNDTSIDWTGVYISIWMRSSSALSYGNSFVIPYKVGGGIYDSQHMGGGSEVSTKVSKTGTVAANTWIEHRVYVSDLQAAISGRSEVKGLGLLLSLVNADGAKINTVDIYSMEICFDDARSYTFASKNTIGLPSLGVANFTQNIEVYNASGNKLSQGVDYTLTSDYAIENIATGEYTLQYVVSGDTIEQTTITRKLSVTNHVAQTNTTDIRDWGWTANGYKRSVKTLTAQPAGYNGTKTTLDYVSGTGGTLNNNELYMVRAGIDISGLIANLSSMKDDQYLSVWFRVKSTGTFTLDHNTVFLDDDASNGSAGFATIELKRNFLKAEDCTNGTWINLRLTKAELNKAGIENMRYLCFQIYDKNTVAFDLDFYAVEILEKDKSIVVEFDPSVMVSAGWHGTATTASNECKNQKLTEVETPNGYNGNKTNKLALHWQSVNSTTNTMAIDISTFLKNIDAVMDDNDVLSIWIKYSPSVHDTYNSYIALWNANSRDNSISTKRKMLIEDYYNTSPTPTRPDNPTTVKANGDKLMNGEWVNVTFTKAQLKTAYADPSQTWLVFYVEPSISATVDSYIYDIAVIKN